MEIVWGNDLAGVEKALAMEIAWGNDLAGAERAPTMETAWGNDLAGVEKALAMEIAQGNDLAGAERAPAMEIVWGKDGLVNAVVEESVVKAISWDYGLEKMPLEFVVWVNTLPFAPGIDQVKP